MLVFLLFYSLSVTLLSRQGGEVGERLVGVLWASVAAP